MRLGNRTTRALLASCALVSGASAQESEHHGVHSRVGTEPAGEWGARELLTGDWNGLRPELEADGIEIGLALTTDSSRPFGGEARHRFTHRLLFEAGVEFDLEHLLGWNDTTVVVESYLQAGRNGSGDVGDIQTYSNIDEDNVAQLAAAWIEHGAYDAPLRVKLGKMDANTEFAYVTAGLPFISSSAGYSPSIFVLPTYPDPAFGATAFVRPASQWLVRAGVFNAEDGGTVSGRRGMTADFDAAFWIGQVDREWNGGRFGFGGWHHTGDFGRFDGGSEDGASGAYALFEQKLREAARGFLQWGVADEAVSPIESHLGAGVLATGLCPEFGDARTGLYATHVNLTDEPGAGLGGSELALELFQEIPLTPAVMLQPDLQWIGTPGGNQEDAWVATLRLRVTL